MSRTSSTILILGAVALGASVLQAQNGGGARKRTSHKIGVVDIGILFKSYKRKDDLEKSINDLREQLKAEVEEDEKKIHEKAKALEASSFHRGSEPWNRMEQAIRLDQFKLKMKEEGVQKRLQKQVEENTLQILNELEATIADYAQRRDFTVVLKVHRSNVDDEETSALGKKFQEEIFRAQISDVVYFLDQPEVNMTDAVLRKLNTKENLRKMELLSEQKGK